MPEIERWDIHLTSGGIVTLRPKTRQFYRVPHDIERVDVNKDPNGDNRYRPNLGMSGYGPVRNVVLERKVSLPEVYLLDPDHRTELDCYWQNIWRQLNPELSDEKWATLLGLSLAWTNKTGFPGHYDCVNQRDTDQGWPALDRPRANGGAILTGTAQSGVLLIETLRSNQRILTAAEILARPWLWFWGTSVRPDGRIGFITRLGLDGTLRPVRVPIITEQQVSLPLDELHALPPGTSFPSPTWLAIN